MNIWLHNPIAEMYGPYFLLFYACAIAITIFVCWSLSTKDLTANLPLPLVPSNPDPYEIAYLRNSDTGVMQLVTFDLLVRDYLQVEDNSIERSPTHPDISLLTPSERELFDWFAQQRTRFLPASFQPHCEVYRRRLQAQQFLSLDEWQVQNSYVGSIGILIILGLGLYKLTAALANGHHNVGFLITMMIFSPFLLWNIVCSSSFRLSDRGRNYLNQLQAAFAQLKDRETNSFDDYNLIVALFGVSVLTGTPYDFYQQIFATPTTSSTFSSSSGGCGSSCGGGCGGGCGGCGG
ncbi:MAG: TIGR04222 domain-containing membrane protein [Cyanosarcina radialis HA8281-LM2]|jgi:uncharacterized protein (TIGR04222 family)|nr:TIGR04222 domain-containing membrane protein [Cyanosarcina radialis HA8281-LM2]